MKKKFGSGIFRLIVAILLILGSLYIGKEAMPLIKLGLDLDGGVSITYQAIKDNPTATEMSDAVYKLQLKSQDYSNEAEVYQEGSNRINIDIPGVSDANAILEELGKPGTLYFVEGELTWPYLASVSEASRSNASKTNSTNMLSSASNATLLSASSSNANVSTLSDAQTAVQNMLGGNVTLQGANVIQHADGSITIGGEPDVEAGDVVLSNGTEDTQNQEVDYSLFDYSQNPIFDDSQIVVTGSDIAAAQGGMYNDNYGQTQYVVDLTFTEEGKTKFSEATARNIGQVIYIIYNGEIVSYPTVQTQISDGRAQITGMADLEQANLLASTIRIGSLPLELEEQRSNVVGAKLGADAISTSLKAGLIGFIIVCLFMIAVYRIPGLAASMALCLYIGLMLFLLQGFEITLTLPGIAGIILSIGMAVDANVIIFTRIKEELGRGKNAKAAIQEGFHKALSAILDGNITTLIAAAVLFLKGTGSIRGFAQTLALGIVLSLFTALFFTRFILKAFLYLGFENPKFYGIKKEMVPINFVKYKKISYTISIVVILIGIIFMFMNKSSIGDIFNYGLDFKGGSSTSIVFNDDVTTKSSLGSEYFENDWKEFIDKKIVPIFENVTKAYDTQTQKTRGSNEVIVKTRTLTLSERELIYEKLQSSYTDGGFEITETNIATENISGAVSTRMRADATIAVIISTILMLIYIWFRFKDIRFASSAVIALLHDCFVTIGCYAIFKWTVDSTFIACMLTIVGYSINATIVIFDRIREELKLKRGESLDLIVNSSITETFTRSLNTSITTFIMVLVLFIMGVSSIRMFALPLMIGIVAGCYSSVMITGPLWHTFKSSGKTTNENKTENKENKKESK